MLKDPRRQTLLFPLMLVALLAAMALGQEVSERTEIRADRFAAPEHASASAVLEALETGGTLTLMNAQGRTTMTLGADAAGEPIIRLSGAGGEIALQPAADGLALLIHSRQRTLRLELDAIADRASTPAMEAMRNLRTQIDAIESAIEDGADARRDLDRRLDQLDSGIGATGGPDMRGIAGDVQRQRRDIDQLRRDLQTAQRDLEQTRRDRDRLSRDLRDAVSRIRTLESKIRQEP